MPGSLAPVWLQTTSKRGCQHMRAPPEHAAEGWSGPGAGLEPCGRTAAQPGAVEKRSPQRDLDALALNFAGQLVDHLLSARPVGMDFEQLFEGLQGGLLLADLA